MGTHEAPRARTLRAAPAPLVGPSLPPPTTTGDAPVPAAPFLVQPAPAPAPATLEQPPSSPFGPAPVVDAPAGSSGLVPLRAVASPSSAAQPTGFVPGASTTTPAATRLRWDEKGARRRASATTFGLTGRIVITVVVVLLVVVLSYGNIFGIPLFLGAAAWLLRDLWAKGRQAPPRAPVPSSGGPRPAAFPPVPPGL